METKINIWGKEFQLKSKFEDGGVNFPNSDDKMLHNKFKITVTNEDKISREFDFYGSNAEYKAGKNDLSEFDLKWAFRCFIEDSNSGDMNFKNFCNGYGYDTDSRRAERIWKSCQKSLNKLIDLGLPRKELPAILDELSKQNIE